MTVVGIDHAQVAAPPGWEAEARRFYGELLGLSEVAKPAPLAERGELWLQCGAQQLHVRADADFEPARKAHPALAVGSAGELERLAEALSFAGVEVEWDDAAPNVPRFFVFDPWGNRLELVAPAAE